MNMNFRSMRSKNNKKRKRNNCYKIVAQSKDLININKI